MAIPRCPNDSKHTVKMRRYRMHTGFLCLDCMEWVRINPKKIWLSSDDIAEILKPFSKTKEDIPEISESPSETRWKGKTK